MPETSTIMDFVLVWALRIAAALVVFFIGRLIVKRIVGLARRYMEGRKLEPLIVNFIGNILNWALLLLVIIIALNQLGVNTTAMVALLGAAGLAVGLALQDSMKNFASGVLLIVFHPFSTGHFVEAGGTSGVVESITLFTSTLLTPDNREVTVPNSAIYTNTITNYSVRPKRRIDMVFGASYGDDLRKAKELLQQIVAADARILAEPPPNVAVGDLTDKGVNLVVQPWVNNADYGAVKGDIIERVKLAFDAHNITFAHTQLAVRVQGTVAQPPGGDAARHAPPAGGLEMQAP